MNLLQIAHLPHRRELEIEFDGGAKILVRLDQGFGFWRAKSRAAFPFEANVGQQVEQLLDDDFLVQRTPGQDTYINVGLS